MVRNQLAKEAIYIEQELLGENVGSQDQISAACGGVNRIDFLQSGEFIVNPVIIERDRVELLESHLVLLFTGFSCIASEVAKSKIEKMEKRAAELRTMHGFVDQALEILQATTF